MKYLLLFAGFLLSATCVAERLYVSPQGNASATGADWNNSLTLEAALARSVAGDEVWTLQGTYFLAPSAGRTASFTIPAGVSLYGGFAGSEASAKQRTAGNYSVLSGDLGVKGEISDNAYSVVTMLSDAGSVSTLDGFTIRDGSARNFREGLAKSSAGGGLYIMAGTQLSNHQITNCLFTNNKAHNGGAVLVDSGRPSFIACVFEHNSADFNGGAVYNKGIASIASPIFRDCTFEDNSSNSGAGMTNNGSNGSSSPLILNCSFVNNTSLMNGAAIYNISNDNGETEPVLEGCSFIGNESILGDEVSGQGVSRTMASKARQNGGGSLRPVARKK